MEKDNIRPIIIGICGGPLTGKTELAKRIQDSILPEYKACIIHMSDYYKILSEEEFKTKEAYNFDRPQAIDFELLISNLDLLINHRPVQLPKYDMITYQRTYGEKGINDCEVIILEGNFSFQNDKIFNLMDLKIFIDVDKDIQLSRIIYNDLFIKNRELIYSKGYIFINPKYIYVMNEILLKLI